MDKKKWTKDENNSLFHTANMFVKSILFTPVWRKEKSDANVCIFPRQRPHKCK